MSDYHSKRYWNRPLTLNELLEEAESFGEMRNVPDEIIIFPPENANDYNTDEDSGEENDVTLNNLPGSQLRGNVEVVINNEEEDEGNIAEDWSSEDDIPLISFVQKKLKKTKNFNFSYGVDLQVRFPEWNQVYLAKNSLSPANTFKLFFDNNLIDDLVRFSNLYALQKNCPGDITTDDMFCFLGVLILSGYNTVARKKMYWQNSDDSNNKLISSSISRDRFQHVMSNFHCVDNNHLDNSDRFAKVRPLFQWLNKKFLDHAPAEENHSVDEAMVPYFGRHGCKQFIRGKPIRWGYKFWVGATRLGYIIYFEPYQGASTNLPEKYKELGLAATVVLQYADILTKSGFENFHLFFDNFFTSLSLLKELTFRKIKGTGTLRDNRITNSPLTNPKIFKKKERGTFEYVLVDNEIVVCRWNDNSVITIASNACPVLAVNRTKRFSQTNKTHIQVDQPKLIKGYNENMGGVDRSDQNIGQYRISIRGKKWYFPLVSHCIDMAVQNAWYLQRFNGGKLDQLRFRRAVASELLETHKVLGKKGPSKKPSNYREHSRFDRIDHLVVYQEKQTKCAVCHKKANFRCEKCDIGLHPKDCFQDYHSL